MKIISLSLSALISAAALASCTNVNAPVSVPQETPVHSSPAAAAAENNTRPAVKFDPGGKPDRSYVKISDRMGSRNPNSPDIEYYIKVQNLHDRWSLINVAVEIDGTVYLIADTIAPGAYAEFYRESLPRAMTSYHVYYDWKAPE
jgi:hypothetical protein